MVPLMMPSALCDADTSASASHDQSHVTHHFDHLDLANAKVPCMMQSAAHYANAGTSHITWQKHHDTSYVEPHLNHLDIMNTVWYWQCCWQHMMLMPVTANNVKLMKESCWTLFWSLWLNNAMVPLMIPSVAYLPTLQSHNQKIHVSPCFSHLDLTNKMVPLAMPSVSFDAGTSASSITWPKKLYQILFQLPSPNEKKWCN